MDLNHVTLPSRDVERGCRFYRALGLVPIVEEFPKYARLALPQGTATLSLELDGGASSEPSAIVYFECERLDEVVATLQRSGVAFESPPTDQPWLWREARLRDPDGNQICLYRAGTNRMDPPWRVGRDKS